MRTNEQELRCEAIRRRLNGERRKDICRDLERSTRWFDKWWAEFSSDPQADLADHSRAPLTGSSVITPELERLVVELRRSFESANQGLIGARAIWGKLIELKVKPLPSEATVQRILARNGLTHPLGAATEAAYYPWLPVWAVNAVQATDIITKHIRGGVGIQNFHTLDLFTQAAALTQHLDKTSVTAGRHLLKAWEKLGLPCLHQFDNEGSFCGGHTHRLIIGRVLRLCLLCGVEAIFTPIYDAKRNHQIETFHSLWCAAFWSRQAFTDLAHVQAEVPAFTRWYHQHYRPRSLPGTTPAQMRFGLSVPKLTADLRRLIPDFRTERLPVTAGRFHFMRKVDPSGHLEFLNERWLVGARWIGEYVRATVSTAKQSLTISHKASDDADWRMIKTRIFRIKESVHDLLPQFRRNRARCRDYLPG
jgi:transposase InsO family protein